jgi:putative transposase
MKPTLAREPVLDAILMAVWRRKPKRKVLIHSDQGTQYGSNDWLAEYESTRQLLG